MRSANRPVVFDVTHLVSRLNRRATTGIDRVDLLYAQHFAGQDRIDCGVHYGWKSPHIFSRPRLRALVERFAHKVGDDDSPQRDAVWENLNAWLMGKPGARIDESISHPRRDEGWRAFFDQCGLRVAHDFRGAIPEGSIYLNVAQEGFEHHRFFEWLGRRPDIKPVFFVHDLLPVDYPEYFRDNYETRFNRRIETILRYSGAIIVASEQVRQRILFEYKARGVSAPPVHVQHLPSPLGAPRRASDEDPNLAGQSYFVMVGTIEPRKNHTMLLHLWREWGPDAPKLVLVGNDGWQNAYTHALIDRSMALRQSVRRVSGLSRPFLRKLIANARAVLMPSLVEGFGLPVIEALSLKAPTIVSDIAVFRETAGDAAIFIHPLDAMEWKRTIEAFAPLNSAPRAAALEMARSFSPPDQSTYFSAIEGFLAE